MEAKAKPVGFIPNNRPIPCIILMIPINRKISAKIKRTTNKKPTEAKPVIRFTGFTISLLIVSIKLSTDSTKLSSCSILFIISVLKLLMKF